MKVPCRGSSKPRSIVVGVLALSYLAFFGFEILHSSGQVGATQKNGFGCLCHGSTASSSVSVWIAGPDTVIVGSRNQYSLFMMGGPAIAGGYNIAAGSGSLSPFDGTSQLLQFGNTFEITHLQPKSFQNDTVRWDFFYQAPVIGTRDTLFSVGNSVNLNGNPLGDQWNNGNNFIVNLHEDTTLDVTETGKPVRFYLAQNFPNPFNPQTVMIFGIEHSSFVTLKVFDALGRDIATLVSDWKLPGTYSVSWNGSDKASGIYLCRLVARNPMSIGEGEFTETKKMLLIR
ncbi:MAG: T9SS type A sorting domain-containing protein [Ignavibacteria bacterium]|nr:T9SS type A sorting domain-containing protein [Ignavibacteria bacterium]